MRITHDKREKIFKMNEGIIIPTSYSADNFSETRKYTFKGEELHVDVRGRSSFSDSYTEHHLVYGMDDKFTKDFIRRHKDELIIPND